MKNLHYCVLINAQSTHTVHIIVNLNMIFYTPVERNPIKNYLPAETHYSLLFSLSHY